MKKGFHKGDYLGKACLEQAYILGDHDCWRQFGGHGTLYFPKIATIASLNPHSLS